ncbi:MAG: hypothetical protein ACI9QL_004880, partial [Candidatus Omnitrophota bacterium]
MALSATAVLAADRKKPKKNRTQSNYENSEFHAGSLLFSIIILPHRPVNRATRRARSGH